MGNEISERLVVKALIDSCKGTEFNAIRHWALLFFLLDTGARASLCG
jgi:hypothetical protein